MLQVGSYIFNLPVHWSNPTETLQNFKIEILPWTLLLLHTKDVCKSYLSFISGNVFNDVLIY